MLLNAIAILNLGLDDKMLAENGPKYIDMINQDEKDLGQLKGFLSDLRADPLLTKQITELKNINYERSHLETQKAILESVSSLKEIKLLLKKAEKPEEFVDHFQRITQNYIKITPYYQAIYELINTNVGGTQEELANKKLETLADKLKAFHNEIHEGIRFQLGELGVKIFDTWKLPMRPESQGNINKDFPQANAKQLLTDLALFDRNESKLKEMKVINKDEGDLVTNIFLNKLLKTVNYYFLSENELNQIDHIEWMTNFISDTIKENLGLFKVLNISGEITAYYINIFLKRFLEKLKSRFSQDLPHYLEHDSLFTNYLGLLKEHLNKIKKLLLAFDIDADIEKNYELSEIYNDSSKLLEKMIADEYLEFHTKILDKINKMDIMTQELPDQKRFDVLLAEFVENFVYLYAKIVRKYEVYQQDYIPKFVKSRLLDRVMNELIGDGLKGILRDVQQGKTAPRLFTADALLATVDFLFVKLYEIEDFKIFDYDPGYKPILKDFRESVFTFIDDDVVFFIKEIKKPLKNYFNSSELLNSYNSQDTVELRNIFKHKDLDHVLEKFKFYTDIGQAKLGQELRERFYNEIFRELDKIFIEDLLKKYKFTLHGLNFVAALLVTIIESLRETNFELFTIKEMRYKEMIKYGKLEKHMQAALVEKIKSIRDSTLIDDVKDTKITSAIKAAGYEYLKENEILSLHEIKLL